MDLKEKFIMIPKKWQTLGFYIILIGNVININ